MSVAEATTLTTRPAARAEPVAQRSQQGGAARRRSIACGGCLVEAARSGCQMRQRDPCQAPCTQRGCWIIKALHYKQHAHMRPAPNQQGCRAGRPRPQRARTALGYCTSQQPAQAGTGVHRCTRRPRPQAGRRRAAGARRPPRRAVASSGSSGAVGGRFRPPPARQRARRGQAHARTPGRGPWLHAA